MLGSTLAINNNSAFAQGDNPATCVNLYNSKITSMTIHNINNHGIQIIPVNISNSNTKFDSAVGLGYNVTFTVHTAGMSNQNNTNPGSVWYDTSANAYQQSQCVNGASPSADMTINLNNLSPGTLSDGTAQSPTWGMWGGGAAGVSYTVTWHQLYVTSTQPSNGATGIPVTGSISATFSKQVQSSTVNSNTFILKDSNNNAVPGTVSLSSDSKTATFTLFSSKPLSYSTTYTATITTGVKDLSGYPLAVNGGPNYKWSFTTAPPPPPAVPHSTTLTLNPITSIPAGNYVTATSKLTDNNASGGGVGGKTITFSGTGAWPQVASGLASAVTNPDGTFTATGRTYANVATGWTVQAHFVGDSYDKASDSAIQSYSTLNNNNGHTSALVLNPVANAHWGTKVPVAGKLTDTTAGSNNVGIGGKTITFTSPNSNPLPPSVVTNTDGTFSSFFTASNTISTGWKLQAHYAGDSNYTPSDSTIQSYSTIKHDTLLSLSILPTSITGGGNYKVYGTLKDRTVAASLGGMTVSFTATSPITISSTTTSTTGQYSVSGLKAPTTAGTYNIRTQFAGTSLYNPKTNPLVKTLTVTTTTTTATTVAATSSHTSTSPMTSSVLSSPSATTTTTLPLTPPASKVGSTIINPPPTGTTGAASNNKAPIILTPPAQQQQQQNPRPQSPIANAGTSQAANGGMVVTLDGRASYSPTGGIIVAYQWTQLATGVPVILTGANTATPTLTTPIVPSDTVLAFSLRIMDNQGAISSNPSIVYVMVKHHIAGGTAGSVPTTGLGANQQQQQPLPSHLPQPSIITIPSQPNPIFHPQLR